MQIAANKVQICLFWKEPLNYNDVETTWPPEMRAVWVAFANAIINLRKRHGQNLPVEMYVCPITDPANAVIVNQNGLDLSLLPAVQVYAEYPDAAANYFLSRNLSERFTGINWTTAEVQPYIEALLYRSKPAEQSVLCKLVPPLCSAGGWVWLVLAVGATFKASATKNTVARVAYGGAAFLLWKGWIERGGLKQLQETFK